MAHWTGLSDCPAWWQVLQDAKGHIAFDIGANGGTVAAMFAKNFDRVVAIEPAVESYEDLYRDAPENVLCINIACAAEPGVLALDVRDNSIRTGQLTAPGTLPHPGWGDVLGTRKVAATTIDTLAEMYGCPDVVKIDTEGFEVDIVAGGGMTVAEKQTEWLIEVHSADLGQQLMPYFAAYNVERWTHSGYRQTSRWRDDHYYLKATP